MVNAQTITMPLLMAVCFIAACFAPVITRIFKDRAGWVLALAPAALFLCFGQYVPQVLQSGALVEGVDWVPTLGIQFSFLIDGLSLMFALLISLIGTFIVAYAGGYMAGHEHKGRFLSFMLLFMGAMLGLVLADNLFTLFVFWELTSITSFLLIGFDHKREKARRAAVQALVVTGGGGLLLLAGLVLITLVTGEMSLSGLLAGQGVQGNAAYPLILVFILAGAFTKSAQFPFHFWLPNAMEAPTPVSAFLHSATMVKAGVYLLARMSPVLAGTDAWFYTLTAFGGVTFLLGAVLAVRQSDMKQMLAYTTLASLGLLVMLLGVGTKTAVLGAVLYLCAHSLFKAALFMGVGSVDHGAGSRDYTELSGLRGAMPITWIGISLAAFSMCGFPIALGFLAKEEIYLALLDGFWPQILLMGIAILGNALMMVVALVIAIKPFYGQARSPYQAHEGGVGIWIGVLVLGFIGFIAGAGIEFINTGLLNPVASSVLGQPIDAHVALHFDIMAPALWASIGTWLMGIFLYTQIGFIRESLTALGRAIGFTFDKAFDGFVFGLVRFAYAVMKRLQAGRLEIYMRVMFIGLALVLWVPIAVLKAWPALPAMPLLNFYEWSAILIVLIGAIALPLIKVRVVAMFVLGVQGFGVAMLFMLFGAPDLSFTQFMVETLSVVILALVMARLYLDARDPRPLHVAVRDGAIAIAVGLGFSLVLLLVLQTPLDMNLAQMFNETAASVAHGRNIVNVILVDYRAIDTLGEISVVMAAGLTVLALIRFRQANQAKPRGKKLEGDVQEPVPNLNQEPSMSGAAVTGGEVK